MDPSAPNQMFNGMLEPDYIHFRNKNQFKAVLHHFMKSGPEKCMLVWDFDYTLTIEFNELGEKQNNSFGAFTSCDSIPDEVKVAMWKEYKKYSIYEKEDESCEQKVRKQKLDEWCKCTNDLLRNVPFNPNEITTATENIQMRSSSFETLSLAKDLKIPSFIVSGGHGDCITRILSRSSIINDNTYVTIISNFLERRNDILNGFKHPMVHALNKGECLIDHPTYKKNASRTRRNIILVGDSLADADMVGKFNSSDIHVLKIGFYNNKDQSLFNEYLEAFDVVLLRCNSMDFVQQLLSLIGKT